MGKRHQALMAGTGSLLTATAQAGGLRETSDDDEEAAEEVEPTTERKTLSQVVLVCSSSA